MESLGPGVDAGDGVGEDLLSLLVLAVMPGHSTVGSLSLDDSGWRHKDTGHKAERSEALSDEVTLDISVVVLEGPYKSSLTFDDLGNHIVN